jgi:hypothetical protein
MVSTPLHRYLSVTLVGRVYRVVEVFPEGHPARTEERSFDSSPYVFLIDNVEQVSPGPKNIPVTYLTQQLSSPTLAQELRPSALFASRRRLAPRYAKHALEQCRTASGP